MRNIIRAIRFIQKMNPVEYEWVVISLKEIFQFFDAATYTYFIGNGEESETYLKLQCAYEEKARYFLDILTERMHSKRTLELRDWFKIYDVIINQKNEKEIFN